MTQIVTRLVVDPFVDFRRLLGKTSYTLAFYANLFYNSSVAAQSPEFKKASNACRDLASEVLAFSAAVALYSLLARLRLIPSRENVRDASRLLVGLSNTRSDTPTSVIEHQYGNIAALIRIRIPLVGTDAMKPSEAATLRASKAK